MNYEDQIIGLKKVIVDMQKRISALELCRERIEKDFRKEYLDTTHHIKQLYRHCSTLSKIIDPIDAKLFPKARIARAKIQTIIGSANPHAGKDHDKKSS